MKKNKLPIPKNCITINHLTGVCVTTFFDDFFGRTGYKLGKWNKPWKMFGFQIGEGCWGYACRDLFGHTYKHWIEHYNMEKIEEEEE